MSRLLSASLFLVLCLSYVAATGSSSSGNHLPVGLAGPGVNLNERFFDQVRALIKRRLQEKELSGKPQQDQQEQQELPIHLADDALALQNQRSYDNVPIPAASVPTPVLVENWPTEQHSFGQVTAVAVDPQGNPVVFHRADRYWDVK